MSFEVDEEILQDFLVEAGELLEQLQEQLVDLENNPDDSDLLNAIFRGYHTVKGGAGFLSLTELVDICHGAENVFDTMRNGQRTLTPELMDVILQATDVVVEMFESVKKREPLEAADPQLIETLHRLSKPESEDPSSPTPEVPVVTEEVVEVKSDESNDDMEDITEDEFEALLDELHGSKTFNGSKTETDEDAEGSSTNSANEDAVPADLMSGASDEDITDDEFEALLDQLHGEGSFSIDKAQPTEPSTPTEPSNPASPPEPTAPSASAGSSDSDDISDDEFEALLDQLHGEGKGPAAVSKPVSPAPTPAPTAKQTPTSETKSQSGVTNEKPSITPKPAAPKPAVKKDEKEKKPVAGAQGETTVRVDTKRLDQIMNMVGELVLVRNRLLSLGVNINDESMTKAIANLDVVTGDLQGAVMKTRMQPIKKVFGRFPRVVRDLARSLKKEISLILEGEETDLDKNLVEALADPLVHLVRNSVDHGIEMPEERLAVGKPSLGTVKLAASQEGDHILLTIEDDGKGMDPDKLKDIAISRGVLDADAAARMTDEEAFNLIFAPGFSTKTEISDISGRGVGMDVVKTKINQLNGTVNISSELGKGTRLEIKVPLTLAILPTLMIVVGEQTFALPLGAVNEIINMDLSKTNTVDSQLTMIVRSKAIPLFYLRDWLTKLGGSGDKNQGHVVVVQIGTQQVGFVVDSLIGQEEVVIKPLDALLQGTPGMAGATITSDGGIALILDIPSLLKRYAKKK
ncbi:chemotaxis protein CheA [Aliiglaciecola sp. 3_MG-2023]|uniref:chemotaxis protein CheA n=1 Tax=Aliiglaciecola sp. 3_MG-2023 TaxID=3062644 RepID=UPI0026E1536C|nr:chemotaxis protein CheA [Aliiglaciecola sp. 3_MG-2023]MDO6693930.1 chemotaxis protein CheA [Aliiglaciecola sp. 3_MG-2023]